MSHSPCFDACKSINPKDPEKVAETLPEIFKLLQLICDYNSLHCPEFDIKYPEYSKLTIAQMTHKFYAQSKYLTEKATDNLPF